ncbi:hypothetical protein [Candidatus Harpocratesius sp.]
MITISDELKKALEKGEILTVGKTIKSSLDKDELDVLLSSNVDLMTKYYNDPIGVDFQKVFPPSIYIMVRSIFLDLLQWKNIKKEFRYAVDDIFIKFQQGDWNSFFNLIKNFLNRHDPKEEYKIPIHYSLLFILKLQVLKFQAEFGKNFTDSLFIIKDNLEIKKISEKEADEIIEELRISFQRKSRDTIDKNSKKNRIIQFNEHIFRIRTTLWLFTKTYLATAKQTKIPLKQLKLTKSFQYFIENGKFEQALDDIDQIFSLIHNDLKSQIAEENFVVKRSKIDSNKILIVLWALYEILSKFDPL